MVTAAAVDALVQVCGADQVRAAGPADSVAGVPAGWVCAPGSADQVAAVLRTAASHDLAVVPRGAGTKLAWGASPERVDLVVDTGRLAGVQHHAPGDLVVTVGAGTPLRVLQDALASAGQRLALDPASVASGATVGGVLATGEAGPLRLRFGAGRDLLIGVEFARADGVLARSGGRVVKNVAGYDVGRLLCGSYGTLGVLTSATFRLHPVPASGAWVCRPVDAGEDLGELLGAVLRAPVAPSAIEVDLASGSGTLAVLLEGTPTGVAQRAASVAGLLGPKASTVDGAPSWWGGYPFGAGEVALKLAVPVAAVPAVLRALWAAAGEPVPVRGSAGTGVLYAALSGDTPERVAGVLARVRDALATAGGSCVVLAAPAAVRESVDLWGPVPGLPLMRRVKEQFDGRRLLSPGRFVGGL